MNTHAYNQIYLNKTAHTIGNMLHNAIVEFKLDGTAFLQLFVQSKIANEFEHGNPKYIAGKSGMELFIEVITSTFDQPINPPPVKMYEPGDEYWTGWLLAHYQWYSGKSFKTILEVVPYAELLKLYRSIRDNDIQLFYDALDAYFEKSDSKLKIVRKHCGITQESLAKDSGVSLNTIRAYERKSKNINKAQVDIVFRLAKALKCDVQDLLD